MRLADAAPMPFPENPANRPNNRKAGRSEKPHIVGRDGGSPGGTKEKMQDVNN
jgi:hypothetical protein